MVGAPVKLKPALNDGEEAEGEHENDDGEDGNAHIFSFLLALEHALVGVNAAPETITAALLGKLEPSTRPLPPGRWNTK